MSKFTVLSCGAELSERGKKMVGAELGDDFNAGGRHACEFMADDISSNYSKTFDLSHREDSLNL